MKAEVLHLELFQITEKVKQLDYKLSKQTNTMQRNATLQKKNRLIKTRQRIKAMLRIQFDAQQQQSCNVS